VIQDNAIDALGYGGRGLGYEGIPRSIAIEFQIHLHDRISIHSNGPAPNFPRNDNALASSGNIGEFAHQVEIKYTPGELRVWMDGIERAGADVDTTRLLDLDDGTAWVGFTSATGGGFANHDILNWTHETLRDPEFRRGDTNVDGQLGIGDPILTLQYLFQGGTISCRDAADANDDGRLDLGDAIGALFYLFQGGIVPEDRLMNETDAPFLTPARLAPQASRRSQ